MANKYKVIFFSVWILILALAPIAVLQNTPLSIAIKNQAALVNVLQRTIGLWAFTLLFFQIVLGSFMRRLTERFGGWIFSFHILEGILAYILIILHPTLFVLFRYMVGNGFDPFYVFIDFCLLCQRSYDLYYTLGRISFWLITISVFAGLFRTATPWLRVNWKKLHILNYLSFTLISLHSLGVGSDIGTFPFSWFHGPAMAIVACIIGYKIFTFAKPVIFSKRNIPKR